MNIVCAILIAGLCLASVSHGKKSIPSFVKLCKQSDPNLDKCVTESIDQLRPYLAKGVPEMKILPMDPLVVPKIELSALNVNASYTDLKFYKTHTFDIRNFHLDLAKNTMLSTFRLNNQQLTGEYSINGKLLTFELNSSGHFNANFSHVDLIATLTGERKMKKQLEYLHFTDLDLKVKIESGTVQMDDLFKGNPELTKRTNEVFNANSADFIQELEPLIGAAMSKFILPTIQNVFNTFPLDDLLPK